MWYLHIHLVCAKLFAFLAIKVTFPFVINWLEQPDYNGKVIFCVTYTAHPHSGWLISRTLCVLDRVMTHIKETAASGSYSGAAVVLCDYRLLITVLIIVNFKSIFLRFFNECISLCLSLSEIDFFKDFFLLKTIRK